MTRKAQKAAKQQEEQQQGGGENGGVPGTSESVSTGTPQVPGSSPREMGNVEPDTPVSQSAEKTPRDGDGIAEGRDGGGDGVFVAPIGCTD